MNVPNGWGFREWRDVVSEDGKTSLRGVVEMLANDPALLRGVKARDLESRFGLGRRQAYNALARARQKASATAPSSRSLRP